jgi:hypothetical protein
LLGDSTKNGTARATSTRHADKTIAWRGCIVIVHAHTVLSVILLLGMANVARSLRGLRRKRTLVREQRWLASEACLPSSDLEEVAPERQPLRQPKQPSSQGHSQSGRQEKT